VRKNKLKEIFNKVDQLSMGGYKYQTLLPQIDGKSELGLSYTRYATWSN